MEVLYAICCGLDVHKASITACLRSPGAGAQRRQEVRTFGTSTRELLRLVDWLTAAGCTHVALESTGVYWRPVSNLLEGSCELFLVNAQHVKMVPGRKTDVRYSAWLAQLLELGLLRRSFVPPAAQRELRDVVRYRKRLIEDRAREANRVAKVLETANIKLASVVTDVLGVSARAMLKPLIAGTVTPEELAEPMRRSPTSQPRPRPVTPRTLGWPSGRSGAATASGTHARRPRARSSRYRTKQRPQSGTRTRSSALSSRGRRLMTRGDHLSSMGYAGTAATRPQKAGKSRDITAGCRERSPRRRQARWSGSSFRVARILAPACSGLLWVPGAARRRRLARSPSLAC
jgi:hypothetical protein